MTLVATQQEVAARYWERRRPRLLCALQVRGGNQAGEDACGPSTKTRVRAKSTTKGKLGFHLITLCVLVIGATALLVPSLATVSAKPRQTIERRIHINPPGVHDSRYAYLPFEVPEHTSQITVTYQYERENGLNLIDIGLFDARFTGTDTDTRGFRGWSGGRRSEFFVSEVDATPGYLPGYIPAGTWRVILGLYRIGASGVDVNLKIAIDSELSAPGEFSLHESTIEIRPKKNLTRRIAGNGIRWWRGDLHIHTVHSDGDWTIAELLSSARNGGLDFISITDHNTSSHHAEIDLFRSFANQVVPIPGEEVTTYGGHMNVWGLPSGSWVDFRAQPGDNARMSKIAAAAGRLKAVTSINHPFAICAGCAWSYYSSIGDVDAMEVWNGDWDASDELALAMWDRTLQSGQRITAVASSDSHRNANPIGKPTTNLASKVLTETAILAAIKRGRAYLTANIEGPFVSFEAEAAPGRRAIIGDELRLRAPGRIRFLVNSEGLPKDAIISLISNGKKVREIGEQSQVIDIECGGDAYYRLEVRDKSQKVLALTNPIYARLIRPTRKLKGVS